jgi:Zn/Cd-binding protein ZinT
MVIKRTKTIRKTNNEIRKYYTKQYVEDILRIRNNLDIIVILKLPI